MFHFMFVHYTFSSVWVAEWPPFGKLLHARLTICSHCILSICNIYLFPVLVLRAGFAFCLLQFLFIAFLLLLHVVNVYSLLHKFIQRVATTQTESKQEVTQKCNNIGRSISLLDKIAIFVCTGKFSYKLELLRSTDP